MYLRKRVGSLRFELILVLAAVVGLPALIGRLLWGWGALYGFNHHSYLLGEAFVKLEKDPAFKGRNKANFPTLAQMRSHEGVNWVANVFVDGILTGPGPDSDGKSPYSWHYYNPNTPEVGGVPDAAKDFYDSLKQGLVAANRIYDGQAIGADIGLTAAWFAHFVADMSCPYHLNGFSADEAKKRIAANNMNYDPKYWGDISSVFTDWSKEFKVWESLNAKDPKTYDWFDPWYFDGFALGKGTHSTHIEWEANWSTISAAGTLTGYAPLFLAEQAQGGNGNPNNFPPFIKKVALETQKLQREASPLILQNPFGPRVSQLLDQAVQNIYTGWRASFSALQPDFRIKADPAGGGNKLTVILENLEAAEAATNIKVTVSMAKGTLKGPASVNIASLDSGKTIEVTEWDVEKDDPAATDAKITVEVTGVFTKTPDSGRAVIEKNLSNLEPTVVAITPSLRDQVNKIWYLEVEVRDGKGKPVSEGEVQFTATGGTFFKGDASVSEWKMALAGGGAGKAWVQADDKKQTITVHYKDPGIDPAHPVPKYEDSEASVDLPPEILEASTVFVVDASGSMQGAKLASAKEAVRNALAPYAGKVNTEEWALFAYFDCGNCRLLTGFTTDPSKITNQLGFEAAGSTPIAYSLQVASNYMRKCARGKKGRIILLTDGGENCSGNPVDAAESISQRKIYFDFATRRP